MQGSLFTAVALTTKLRFCKCAVPSFKSLSFWHLGAKIAAVARPALRKPTSLVDFRVSDSGDLTGIYVCKIHELCIQNTQPRVFNLHG